LAAIFEIGRRLALGPGIRPKLDHPEAIYALLAPEMQTLRREVLRVLLLNTKYEMVAMEEVSAGSVNESVAHPREIFRPALVHSAFALVLAHNHPSGDPAPSEADRRITARLSQSAEILGIKLLDHVIIGAFKNGNQPYFSFREAGLL
jgi:DNA repair protein RadC